MSNLGTFDTFTTAQLGIYAAQHGLRVTGNNISNISTVGYTRQRIDQVSFKVGGADMYRSQLDNHVGSGALVTGISQIRDPYLDIRFRNVSADVGYTDTWLDGLKNIASVLDEVGKGFGEDDQDGMLYAQLQDLADALRGLSDKPCSDNDTLVRTSVASLCNLFNIYAGKLQDLYDTTETRFKQDVSDVNGILTNIRNLNEEIRNCEIHGDSALEMRDERNRQIDALAEYMHINVIYSMEDIGAGQEVEKLTITLANDNPDGNVTTDSSMLIDGIYGAQISVQHPVANTEYNPDEPIGPTNLPYMGKNGKPTDSLEDAAMEFNPNYNVTISKLYDSKGRLWNNPTTTWREIDGTRVDDNAVFRFEIKRGATKWEDGDKFYVGNVECTVSDTDGANNISIEDANNPAELAKFIAARLTNTDYTIKSDGAYIVYTANNPGEPGSGGNAPAAKPSLNPYATDADGNVILDGDGNGTPYTGGKIGIGGIITKNPGYTTKAPAENSTTIEDNKKTEIIYTQLANGKWYEVKTVTEYSQEVELDDNDLYGSLQASRELLTEKGEFATQADVDIDENALSKRGILYYQMSLDLLARQVATQYNNLNKGYMVNQKGNYIDDKGQEVMLPGTDGVAVPISKTDGLTTAQKQNIINNDAALGWVKKDADGNFITDDDGNPVININKMLEDLGAMPAEGSGNLFSIRNDTDVDADADGNSLITAANITVSKGWSTGATNVITTFVQLFGEDGKPLPNTTQSENANHMITMIEKALVYDPKLIDPDAVGEKLFVGGFNDMFSNMMGVEAKDERIMNVKLTTSYASQVELDSNRDGVSGVDLNDEAMNMMQYQKAYSAACRLMTVIDEVLDRLINNTGVAGR